MNVRDAIEALNSLDLEATIFDYNGNEMDFEFEPSGQGQISCQINFPNDPYEDDLDDDSSGEALVDDATSRRSLTQDV